MDIHKHNGFSFDGPDDYVKTSEATRRYNCIAWAARDTSRWWWPRRHAYWPENAPREETVEAFSETFQQLGYEESGSASCEPGYEKIAIFAKGGKPTHMARQLIQGKHKGKWTSKLGNRIDIAHELEAVGGDFYGDVALILRRSAPRKIEAENTSQAE